MIARTTALGLAALLVAGAARAQEADPAQDGWSAYVDSAGAGYEAMAFEGGVLLSSAEEGAGDLILRADCVAAGLDGFGTWGQANGGFLVSLPGRDVGFPRQELDIEAADCPLE